MSKNKVLAPVLVAGLLNYGLGLFIGYNIGDSRNEREQERVIKIQNHNRQIEEQLVPSYKGLGRLILNDATDTFEFRIDSTEFPDQKCTGKFEVQNNTAKAVGDIACIQTRKIGDK